ncbi:MAG: sarcosine oxidase subunit gamma [Chloroflexi bacterium]|nr:MAG: sarcosine oxidase subunit gamma [Chloroflexota bacterium]
MLAVIAEAIRRSPLADYAERFAALHEATNGAISIRELPFLTQINLRAQPDQRIPQRLADVLGLALPLTPNTVASSANHRALWLGPDEWLIVGAADEARAIEHSMRDAVTGATASIVDVSANRTVMLIQGERAQELLAHGIAIDLHPRAFGPGRCAQTLLAKVQVIMERRSDDNAFHVYVRGSFTSSLADWLLDAVGRPE